MSLIEQYSDDEFRVIVRTSTSYREVAKKLGYVSNSGDLTKIIGERVEKLNIDTSHFGRKRSSIKRTEENIFIKDSTASQQTLRKWYLKGEYTSYICSICGQPPEWQSKPMTLILDHINGINNDDRLENLRWVCPNCNQQLDTTNGKNIKRIKAAHKNFYATKKNYCIDCGKEISPKSQRCVACNAKARVQEVTVSREELKNLIRTTPFTRIGEQYHVTDNAVRKWCDKYGLPRKVSDIKKYSDEDWSKI